MGRDGLGDREVAHAGFDARGAVYRVNLENAAKLRKRQQHAFRMRQRAAGKPGAGAARDHRHAVFAAGAEDVLNLFDGFGQRHETRQLAVGG